MLPPMGNESTFTVTSGELARRLRCTIVTAHKTAARLAIRSQRLPNGWTLFDSDDVDRAERALAADELSGNQAQGG
jgi:hypothetical protein